MNDWDRESTRLFIDELLKEDLGLGPMIDDGQSATIFLAPTESKEDTILDSIKSTCDSIDLDDLSGDDMQKLKKILKYLNRIKSDE